MPPPSGVRATHCLHVMPVPSGLHEFRQSILLNDLRESIVLPFDLNESATNEIREYRLSQTQSRVHGFAEDPDVSGATRIELVQHRSAVAVAIQLAVVVIVDDENVTVTSPFEDRHATLH